METKDELASRFARYSRYGNKFSKAVDAVWSGNVKKHVFLPSGRFIFTVVGRDGEEFIDPERPFCSCSNFFFKVLGGGTELCYHLLSYKIALESKDLETITFNDEEYTSLLSAISRDVLTNLRGKEDKTTSSRADTEPR